MLGKQHRRWHNQERPHSSLEDQTPAEFAQRSGAGTLKYPLRIRVWQELIPVGEVMLLAAKVNYGASRTMRSW